MQDHSMNNPEKTKALTLTVISVIAIVSIFYSAIYLLMNF